VRAVRGSVFRFDAIAFWSCDTCGACAVSFGPGGLYCGVCFVEGH